MEHPLFHLARVEDWRAALEGGEYRPPSLASEGFVHCSHASQMAEVADRLYRGQRELVLLRIDPAGLDVRQEDGFPHVYSAIPVEAVVRADLVPPDLDGHLLLAGLLSY